MDGLDQARRVRLAVTPGLGWIARRDDSLIFVPPEQHASARHEVATLAARFLAEGPSDAVRATPLQRCILDWTSADGVVDVDSTFELTEELSLDRDTPRFTLTTIPAGRTSVRVRADRRHAILSDIDAGGPDAPGDLRDGDGPGGGFVLVMAGRAAESSTPIATPSFDTTADAPQFHGVADLDVTLTPFGPITYPDDDTDRTFRRPGDIRCPRGHANPNTNVVCRLCGDPLDSTASRSGPRASTAVAGLALPDGSVIPINRTIVVGRSPDAAAARVVGSPRLVRIDAAVTVSRTHVVVRVDQRRITVTDCDARGRTAVVSLDDDAPVALTPWQPHPVSIGDTIHLGGPTTLRIADPAELRVPPALAPTARPPERDENT
ncbi:MAG: FHA domain-containing protein [Ilumatobacter sp.]|uniref:FHA domain-containing protein n=1 Tax=Ilumatobacter sp. TaxID=1967498 RepID=UPI0032992E9C